MPVEVRSWKFEQDRLEIIISGPDSLTSLNSTAPYSPGELKEMMFIVNNMTGTDLVNAQRHSSQRS
jgi:hypothetical protein